MRLGFETQEAGTLAQCTIAQIKEPSKLSRARPQQFIWQRKGISHG
jgi:hypothetical protein